MKIVCESCGAKYSIADDRVSGKVFKIRCKRCSEVIIVRGDQSAQPAQEQAAPTQDQTAIWHVVVEGEQAGPYAPPQLADMLSAGSVDWDAYVWTEGFDNWLPMRDVADLVAQITGGAAAQPPASDSRAAAYRSAVHETLTGQPSMGADPFADDAAPSDGGLFGGGAAVSASPDLFARGQAQAMASPFAISPEAGVVASGPSPRMDAGQMMTGARNENSVLFSLKNLQALATGSGTSMPSPAAIAPERTGYAAGEGSGLIDIRALATSTGVGDNSEGAGARDELLSMGSHGGAFGTLGSPMLSPAGDEGDGGKKLLIWAGVAAVGFVSLAAVAIIYLMRPTAPAPAVGIAAPTAAPAPTAVAAAQPPPTAALSEGEQQAAARATATGDHERGASERSGGGERRRRSGDSSATKSDGDPMAAPAASERKDPAPSKPGGPKSLDELLDGALSGSSSKGKTAAAAADTSGLPKQPSRDQVRSAMAGVKPAVDACGTGGGGVAIVTVSVAGETGRVTNATVSGVTGPSGSCIARAARGAQFPKFQQSTFKISFPFKL